MERETTWHKERRDRRDASSCERREGLPRRFTLKSPTNTNQEVKGGPAESKGWSEKAGHMKMLQVGRNSRYRRNV